MRMDELTKAVHDIICEMMGCAPEHLKPSLSLVEDLGFDSLDVVETIMALEQQFDAEIFDEDVEKLMTVDDVVRMMASLLTDKIEQEEQKKEETMTNTNTNTKCPICGADNCATFKRQLDTKYAATTTYPTYKETPVQAPKPIIQQTTKIVLVDTNPTIVDAFRDAFEGVADVECVQGSILNQKTDAWVSPTNSKGSMSGGVDAAIKGRLGPDIEQGLQRGIKLFYNGSLPIGRAVSIPVDGITNPKFVVATPTMMGETDDVSRTKNTALACAAAFQAIYSLRDLIGNVKSIAIPGLGSGTGKMPAERCAKLMFAGYSLFKSQRFASFEDMEKALYKLLEEMDILAPAKPKNINIDFSADAKKVADVISFSGKNANVFKLTPNQRAVLKVLDASSFKDPTTIGSIAGPKGWSGFVSNESRWACSKLKALMKKGLVEKQDHKYRLSAAGSSIKL